MRKMFLNAVMYTATGKGFIIYKKDFQLTLKSLGILKIHKSRPKNDRLQIMKDIVLSYVASDTIKNDKYI